jgi:hypothetical protein
VLADSLPPAAINAPSRTEASETGVLAYPSGPGTERLVWRFADGREVRSRELDFSTNLALSPDGQRVLVNARTDLMLLDLETERTERLGSTLGDPVWAPDGHRFVHRTAPSLNVRSVDDARETVLVQGGNNAFPEDWSRDGRWIVVGLREGPHQVALIPATGGEPIGILPRGGGLANVDEMHFSPDGRWLSFNALSGDRHEVFVMPLPATGQRWQVSTNGGVQPRWHPSGRTLYFLAPDGKMMASEIGRGTAFSAGVPKPLFDTGIAPTWNFDDYRIAPDGRFLLKQPLARGAVRIVLNWPALLSPQ